MLIFQAINISIRILQYCKSGVWMGIGTFPPRHFTRIYPPPWWICLCRL